MLFRLSYNLPVSLVISKIGLYHKSDSVSPGAIVFRQPCLKPRVRTLALHLMNSLSIESQDQNARCNQQNTTSFLNAWTLTEKDEREDCD